MDNTGKSKPKLIYETPESQYMNACFLMQEDELIVKQSYKKENYLRAAEMFESVGEYKDAVSLARECRTLAEKAEQDAVEKEYAFAVFEKDNAKSQEDFERTSKMLDKISGYKDADSLREECLQIVHGMRRRSRLLKGSIAAAAVLFIFLIVLFLHTDRWELLKADIFGNKAEASQEIPAFGEDSFCAAEEGAVVSFGQYQWEVIDNNDGYMRLVLLHAEKSVDLRGRPYNSQLCPVTWETSTIRSWLNEDFYEQAFSDEEKAVIQTDILKNESNSVYGTAGGSDTPDKVCLPSSTDILAHPDVFKDIRMNLWLRDPGHAEDTAMFMSSNTKVMDYGYAVDSTDMYCVPMIRIALD